MRKRDALPAAVALLLATAASSACAQIPWRDALAHPTIERPLPAYDRSDGLSLPLTVSFGGDSSLRIAPSLTYRSQLGRLDPGAAVSHDAGAGLVLDAWVGRGTFSPDAWIWSDLINSTETLLSGDDARDYYRAVRESATFGWRIDRSALTLEPYVGEQVEAPRTVRPDSGAAGGPWSLFGRHDANDMLRPNPTITARTLASATAGFRFAWNASGIDATADLREEFGEPTSGDCVDRCARATLVFAQTAFDGTVAFATFGEQRLHVHAHGVITTGAAPVERLVHLGGPGTLPTIPMLSSTGDRLIFLDAGYDVPLPALYVPFIGESTLTLREVLGGTALSGIPALAQLEGARLSAGIVYAEMLMDTRTRAARLAMGIAAAR